MLGGNRALYGGPGRFRYCPQIIVGFPRKRKVAEYSARILVNAQDIHPLLFYIFLEYQPLDKSMEVNFCNSL